MKNKCEDQFAVIGLGRFGMSILKTLAEHDVNILACDKDPSRLQAATEYAAHVVQADAADEDAMKKLGLGNFDVLILAMGEDFEAAVMATMLAKDLGVKKIVAKAFGPRQKKILENLGADRVILPEMEMGVKVARSLVNPNILDVFEQSGMQRITEMHPDLSWVGKTMSEANIRKVSGYTILAVMRQGQTYFPVSGDLRFEEKDIIVAIEG